MNLPEVSHTCVLYRDVENICFVVANLEDLGHPYFFCSEAEMQRISDNMLECVVYLYPSKEDAKRGERVGGSGFLLTMKSKRVDDLCFGYVVTNSHVVQEANSSVIRLNTHEKAAKILQSKDDSWTHQRDNDLAVCSIALDVDEIKFGSIDSESLISKEVMEHFDIGIGDEAFMVGRYLNREGRQKNTPSVRFGNISMMAMEDEKIYNSATGKRQTSFLVEMRSVTGYSGSPVFISVDLSKPRPNQHDYQKEIEIAGTPIGGWLLGVEWGYIFDRQKVKIKDPRSRKYKPHSDNLLVEMNTGMSCVVPAWKLRELIYNDKHVNEREQIEERILEMRKPKNGGAVSAS